MALGKGLAADVGAWAMNVFSSVGIILVNKAVMKLYRFYFATSLTGMHFVVTALFGLVGKLMGYISSKPVPFLDVLWYSVIANVSVVGMNVTLLLNSVGFYQISKLSLIPTMCFLEYTLHSKTFSKDVVASVMIVLMGVGICTVTDVSVNGSGLLAAVIAILATSMQQVSIGALQKKHCVGSFDLLSRVAPVQAGMLVVTGPFVDYFLTGKKILDYEVSSNGVFFILMSCTLAVFCNLSQFICIGRFSAVSFQVLGHMKTVLVLVLGWALYDSQESQLTFKKLAGMLLAIAGMFMYGHASERDKERAKQQSMMHSLSEPLEKAAAPSELTALLMEDAKGQGK